MKKQLYEIVNKYDDKVVVDETHTQAVGEKDWAYQLCYEMNRSQKYLDNPRYYYVRKHYEKEANND
ncbi:MAG: hypothetical protein GY861_16620 [bacterium]|nr:hypothetical protein [bacterium]